MAKTIAIKIDVQGTAEQQKKLAQLETSVKKLTNKRTELNKAVKEGNISMSKYGAEIARVNTKLKANRREMLVLRENILGLDSFTKKLGKSFARLVTSIGGAFIGLFAIQKVGQLFSQALSTIKEFEQQMAKVKAVSGATAQEFAALEKNAKELGASTQFTATQVGQLQEEFAKLGFSTDQILDATEATLELAVATGSDLAQSAKVAASVINGFGMEAKDTQKVVDVMAKSFSSSALDIDKFEVAMRQVAPVAADAGLSIEETTGFLGVLADNGIRAETAGTGLRNIFLTLAEKGLTLNEALTKINTSTNSSAAASKLFGKENAVVATTLAKTIDKTADFTKELKNANGAASAMARIVGDTLEGDIKKFGSAWEGLVLNLGENGQDLFRDIVQGATDFIDTLGDLTKNIHAESDAMREQQVRVNALASEALGLKVNDENRLKILNEIDAINPNILEGLDKQTLSHEDLQKAINKSNSEMINQIILQKELEKIQEQQAEAGEVAAEIEDYRYELSTRIGDRLLRNNQIIAQGVDENSKFANIQKYNIQRAEEENKILKDSTLNTSQKAQELSRLASKQGIYNDFNRENAALLVRIRKGEEDLKEENEKLSAAKERRNQIAERLGVTLGENNKKDEESIDLTKLSVEELEKLNSAAARLEIARRKAAKGGNEDLKSINEEFKELGLTQEDIQKALTETLSEVTDEMDEIEVGFSNAYDAKKKEVEDFTDLYAEQAEAMGKIDDELNQKRVEDFVNSINKQKELEAAKDEAEKNTRLEKIAVAEEAANAIVEVTNRKVEREKTLELDALNAQLENGLITQEQFEKKREAIEKKAFQKQKRLEIAQVQISLARELASIAANSAGNPLNAFSGGSAGAIQNRILAGIAVARAAIQTGVIASQSFAEGGFTGSGFGSPDASGFKQAGVVHEGEYVVPKNVLETNRGGALVGALESMRLNRPQPYIGTGFANGGFTSMQSVDMVEMENRIARAVTKSMGAIQVVNNAVDTVSEAVKVSNIQQSAQFG